MRCEEIMRSESRIFSACSTFLTIRDRPLAFSSRDLIARRVDLQVHRRQSHESVQLRFLLPGPALGTNWSGRDASEKQCFSSMFLLARVVHHCARCSRMLALSC